jgi:hypothetical protein
MVKILGIGFALWFASGAAIGAGVGALFKQALLGGLIGFCLSGVLLAAMLRRVQ